MLLLQLIRTSIYRTVLWLVVNHEMKSLDWWYGSEICRLPLALAIKMQWRRRRRQSLSGASHSHLIPLKVKRPINFNSMWTTLSPPSQGHFHSVSCCGFIPPKYRFLFSSVRFTEFLFYLFIVILHPESQSQLTRSSARLFKAAEAESMSCQSPRSSCFVTEFIKFLQVEEEMGSDLGRNASAYFVCV